MGYSLSEGHLEVKELMRDKVNRVTKGCDAYFFTCSNHNSLCVGSKVIGKWRLLTRCENP